METEKAQRILVETNEIESAFLNRDVKVDFYLPKNVADPSQLSLLLINDGQDLEKMGFEQVLNNFITSSYQVAPLLCVAIHCGANRKLEYGVAGFPDYLDRGNRADLYTRFVLQELLPFMHKTYCITSFKEKAFAGFSLGGLSALDIVWANSGVFQKVGVFSGSHWWRSIDQNDPLYDENTHRIIHQQIRNGKYVQELEFFFQCGCLDETKDRNNNGIIDSIDDTLDLIKELKAKGYSDASINYLELADGKHDVPTWGRAMPAFLKWGWNR
jgi:enterochelin esterase-like enzyme